MLLALMCYFTRVIKCLFVVLRCFILEPQDFNDKYNYFTITFEHVLRLIRLEERF
jgi:hypothetical protein